MLVSGCEAKFLPSRADVNEAQQGKNNERQGVDLSSRDGDYVFDRAPKPFITDN